MVGVLNWGFAYEPFEESEALSLVTAQSNVQVQHGLLSRIWEARSQTDQLFSLVKEDFLYQRPIAERHRIIFYLGHLEAFDWNLVRERLVEIAPFNPKYDQLFAFGIDPVDGGFPADSPGDWPSLPAVRDYVAQVRRSLDDALENLLASGPNAEAELLLNVAVEHRLMHAETFAYMLNQAPAAWKLSVRAEATPSDGQVVPKMLEIPAGSATLGLRREDSQSFGWDNEYEAHTVAVPAFEIDKYEITNREYLEFVNSGGYENQSLWKEADWKWKTEQAISHPGFWRLQDGVWFWRGMFGDTELPLDWPVYVSHAEASAYAKWVGKGLPTETQWHRAAYGSAAGERKYPWGDDEPSPRFGNFDFQRWDPSPVNAFPAGQSAFGVMDLVGNGWEWTSTVFAPFAGFQPFPFYRGYSANFFDGKHFVMKGGSSRTAACLLRRSFRNWFQPHYPHVSAGFRCVRNHTI
jgi:iron(II)-dependent oxidoreductase